MMASSFREFSRSAAFDSRSTAFDSRSTAFDSRKMRCISRAISSNDSGLVAASDLGIRGF